MKIGNPSGGTLGDLKLTKILLSLPVVELVVRHKRTRVHIMHYF